MPESENAWPTYGEPHDAEGIAGCEGIGWDLSFGFRLNVGHADHEDVNSPLTIGAHFSDADLARGFCERETSPAQLEEFARLLLNLAAKHKQRQQQPTHLTIHKGDKQTPWTPTNF